ncbi:MAG: NmrA family NAD(P)-binding protein [Pseudomonadota bacterium]
MHTIFLIGATGKVGGAAAEHLAQFDNLRVIAGVRDETRAKAVLPNSIETRPFDLDDRDKIDAALKGVDAVLLLTGYTVDMLKQSKRVVDSARAAGVRHIVHVGASGNDTAEVAHWGWHRMIQAYIAASGLSYTFLQPEAFMQNITAFGWLQGNALTNLIGDAAWSWVDARDVGLLAAEALRRPNSFAGETWRLGYAQADMAQVADMIGVHRSAKVSLAPLDPQVFYEAAVDLGGDPVYLTCIRDQFRMNAAGEIADADAIFDQESFKAATGRLPLGWTDYLRDAFPSFSQVA